jgi:hypothetical protein
VPATAPSLPPIDPEADRFIADQFQSHPEARYRITQMAVVQEAALAEAGNRIQQLQQALQQAQQAQQQAAQPQSKGFFGGLFGSGAEPQQGQSQGSPWNQGPPRQQQYAPQQPQYAPPPPNYPPNVQQGTFQRGGSGFLGSALSTAAGVAGGVVGANLLMDMFSGHSGGGLFGGGGGAGAGGFGGGMPQETIINNNYGDAAPQDPGAGGWDNNASSAPDPGWDDNSQGPDSGGWDDNSSGGGGWDDNSNS